MRRFVYQHPRVYQYSGTKKKFCARRACAPTSYVHQSSITYVVPEPLEAPYVPRKMTNSLKVGSHDENRRSPRYCFLYQGTGVSTGKKIQNNTGILLALDE